MKAWKTTACLVGGDTLWGPRVSTLILLVIPARRYAYPGTSITQYRLDILRDERERAVSFLVAEEEWLYCFFCVSQLSPYYNILIV